jgi:hypothetical protein
MELAESKLNIILPRHSWLGSTLLFFPSETQKIIPLSEKLEAGYIENNRTQHLSHPR